MVDKTMPGDSFEFRGINFLTRFGIKVVKIDFLLPPKRERKIQIPGRHGKYDFGSECWEERIIRIDCDVTKKLSRGELREVSALLGKKGNLYLWDEPDKFYVGEVFMAPEIFEYPKANIRTFTVEWVCEPFAYRETSFQSLQKGRNVIAYEGTESTPCQIVIKNVASSSLNRIENMTVQAVYRRK